MNDQSIPNTFENLFRKERNSQKHGVVICGHRGGCGTSEPENTMRAFKSALDRGIECIEFDTWLTSDDQTIVVHGGENGELPKKVNSTEDPNAQTKYIFESTYEEVQANHRQTQYFINSPQDDLSLIPTLDQVLDLIKNDQDQPNKKKTCFAIEVKVPYDKEPRDKYRWQRSMEVLFDLIQQRGLQDYCFIQSFFHPAVKAYEKIAADKGTPFNTMYLDSYFYNVELAYSNEQMASTQGNGTNMQIHMVTKDLVGQMQANGKIIAIWADNDTPSDIYEENDEYYKKAYDLGVKMITTDYPERANEVLQKHHAQQMQIINQCWA